MMYQQTYDYCIYQAAGIEGFPVWRLEFWNLTTRSNTGLGNDYNCSAWDFDEVEQIAREKWTFMERKAFRIWAVSHQSSPATTTASTVMGIS
jgi:hypothetical protein